MLKCRLTAAPAKAQLCQTRDGSCARFASGKHESQAFARESAGEIEGLSRRLDIRGQNVWRADLAQSGGRVRCTPAFGGLLLVGLAQEFPRSNYPRFRRKFPLGSPPRVRG